MPSKEDRRELRKRLQNERDQWDLHICTGFKRVYPSDDPVLQEKYHHMHNQSTNLFKDYTSGKTNDRTATRGESKNTLKTNPLPKAKAADLNYSSTGKETTPQKGMNGTSQKFNYVKSSGYGKQSNQKQYPNPNNPYSGGMKYQNGNIVI